MQRPTTAATAIESPTAGMNEAVIAAREMGRALGWESDDRKLDESLFKKF